MEMIQSYTKKIWSELWAAFFYQGGGPNSGIPRDMVYALGQSVFKRCLDSALNNML